MRKFLIDSSSLLSSTGTLVCCALPAFLVAIGAGAVMASLVSAVPQLIWISQYKTIVFPVVGCILSANAFVLWKSRRQACPADQQKAEACASTKRSSLIIYFVALGFYFIGLLFSFIIPLFI